jgi:hypothetical protein
MPKTLPIHGILGVLLLAASEFFLFKKVEPFYSWFYCFAWWSYILIVDAVIFRIKGNSLIRSRGKEFLLMIPWSVFVWVVFEAANFSLKNWYYVNLPHSPVERWLGYAVAFGTVLPGLFETTELLETLGLLKKFTLSGDFPPPHERRGLAPSNGSTCRPITRSRGLLAGLVLLGASCLSSSALMPEYFFPLIWIGFILLLEPFNYWSGGRSLLRDLEEGTPRKIYLLLIAGLICGILWEFWNYWSPSKWIYTVPFFDRTKGFEMPFLGFLGFLPFAVEAYVMYNFVSLFRFKRGWEKSTYRLHPEKKTRKLTAALTAILMVSLFVLVFRAMDLETVDSYYPRLKDAYWIPAPNRAELPKVGIASLDDLIQKSMEKTERDELALRLLVPREEVISWIDRARLALLSGLGVENLRLLETAGISSVSSLALQDPEKLHEMLTQAGDDRPVPSVAKIRMWIGEAKKQVRSSE